MSCTRPRSLPNGKSKPLKMDILIPESARKRAIVVYVPGGGFVVAAKEGALNLRTYVAEAGFVVASVEYRTTRDGANYRDGVEDIKAAIRYLRANAGRIWNRCHPVAVWGESAGGYLAAMVGVTNGNSSFVAGDNLNQSSDVQGVIDDFGASDISKIAADFDAATQRAIYTNEGIINYIGKTLGCEYPRSRHRNDSREPDHVHSRQSAAVSDLSRQSGQNGLTQSNVDPE